MTVAEAILRGCAGLGAVAIVISMLYFGTRDHDDKEGIGCLLVLAGLIALTLAIGAVAGPEAVRSFWGA